MQQLRSHIKNIYKNTKQVEYRVDQWILRNPIALFNHFRFRFQQKTTYNTRYRHSKFLIKWFVIGYLFMNLMEREHNDYCWHGPRPLMTQYEILASYAQYDHLEQVGKEPHLKSLFAKGKKQGLSQVQLFELSKHLDLNYTSKSVVQHAQYIRMLKS